MCSAREKDLIDETFKFILSGAKDQDVYMFLAHLGRNRATRRQAAQFLKDNYDEFYKRFSTNTQLPFMIRFPLENLSTEADAKDIEAFFKDKDVSKYNLVLRQTVDTVRANAALLERSTEDVSQWLKEWDSESKL
ncbi:hypothetical protein M0805_004426 [Coniferiporia weirii]|nr:hypothetical protein M0805_004426 [Coniferiporia weirii]